MPCISHSVRHSYNLCKNTADTGILLLGLANAFNSISRTPIIDFVARKFPEARPWTQWSLCRAAPLLTNRAVLSSQTGVQQGDPLGPFLFACGIHDTIQGVQAEHGDSYHVYFLDDGTIAGPLTDLNEALGKLEVRLQAIDLRINMNKTRLITTSPWASYTNLRKVGKVESEGFELLGTPVGTVPALQHQVSLKFQRAHSFCEKVQLIHNSQVAIALLRFCNGACKVVHLAKALPPSVLHAHLERLDEAMVSTFQACCRVVVSPSARKQIFLPSRYGGVGLGSSVTMAAPAFTTTVQRFLASGAAAVGAPPAVRTQALNEFPSAVEALRHVSPPEAQQALAWLEQPSATVDVHENFSSQSWWSDLLAKHARNILLDSSTARDRARLFCIADEFASCWLEPCPTESLGLRLSSSEFTVLMKWWLGQAVTPDLSSMRCPACGDAADVFGDHALACKRGGFVQRHSAVIGFLWHLATAAGLRVRTEVGVGGPERPGDLWFSHWKGAGPLAVDGVIVHPLNPSLPYTSIKTGLEAVTEEEQRKRDKNGPLCAAARVAFEPFAMSTFGRLGESSSKLFKELIALLPEAASKDEREKLSRRYSQQLQLALKRDIARMLLQGSFVEVPARPGTSHALAELSPSLPGRAAEPANNQEANREHQEGHCAPEDILDEDAVTNDRPGDQAPMVSAQALANGSRPSEQGPPMEEDDEAAPQNPDMAEEDHPSNEGPAMEEDPHDTGQQAYVHSPYGLAAPVGTRTLVWEDPEIGARVWSRP